MLLSILRSPTDSVHRLAPVEPRYAPLFCFLLLTAACALASFAFSCATPFAAIAVVAAATLPLQSALLVTVGAWLVNQGIGFGWLHYPIDTSTILWGLVIGGAAFAATAASMAVLRLTQRTGAAVALSAAFIGAYATYELVIFTATPFLGGADDFSIAIIVRLGIVGALWLFGLVAACEIARFLFSERWGHAAP